MFELVTKGKGYIMSFHSLKVYMPIGCQSKRSCYFVSLPNNEAIYSFIFGIYFKMNGSRKMNPVSTGSILLKRTFYLYASISCRPTFKMADSHKIKRIWTAIQIQYIITWDPRQSRRGSRYRHQQKANTRQRNTEWHEKIQSQWIAATHITVL